LAVKLALDAKALKKINRQLEHNRSSGPLFDTERFVRNLESAYEKMHLAVLKGKKLSWIEIDDPDHKMGLNAPMGEI